MECLNGKPKIKNYTCLAPIPLGKGLPRRLLGVVVRVFIRQFFKFAGSQLLYIRPTTYILHSGLLGGNRYFTTYNPRILLEKGRFSTLSTKRETLSEPEISIINTDNQKNFYE